MVNDVTAYARHDTRRRELLNDQHSWFSFSKRHDLFVSALLNYLAFIDDSLFDSKLPNFFLNKDGS